jgi:hypothetical protein
MRDLERPATAPHQRPKAGAASAAPISAVIECEPKHWGQNMRDLPPELRAQLLEERREANRAADNFVRVCRKGRADSIQIAAGLLDDTLEGWRLAMIKIGRLEHVTPEVQNAFVTEWIIRKGVARKVGNRPACATALRLLLPGGYLGPPLMLYRGTDECERRRHLYSFSWTTDVAMARLFAQRHADNAIEGMAGIVLQTIAPPEAVLLIRQPEGTGFDEGEVVVDPYRLGKVTVHERLPFARTSDPCQ